MNISDIKQIILNNLIDKNSEFKRIFHGRGNFYEAFNYLTVDSIDDIFYVCFFEEVSKDLESDLLKMLFEIYELNSFKTFIFQRRYLLNAPCEVLKGELKENNYAIENDIKYNISFINKNIGIFPDMKIGREFIQNISKDKSVLNLFSYTCAFSLSALKGDAKKVVNVDMSKGALTQGRANHHLNNFNTKKVEFMPYNILKSWNRIKKSGPYDIIIIDPPSFQKGSFEASKDYEKIIKKLSQLAKDDCTVLSCLNAPELDVDFIKGIFEKNAPEFKFVKRLNNLSTFPCLNEEKTLKNLIFKRALNV